MINTIEIILPKYFNFWRTVYSHGWCVLAPFSINKEKLSLNRVLRLSDGLIADCEILSNRKNILTINASSNKTLSNKNISEIREQIADCLRLNEDFSEFFNTVKSPPELKWIYKLKTGRLLRAPTVFEDIIKTICTTNCSWSLTEIMVENLVGELGEKFNRTSNCFPTPESIARKTEHYMRKTIRAGYRAPYILEFAESVASGKLDVEKWRTSDLSTDELYKQVRNIKGVGDYAAGNILKLLGRYDYLGLDSWVRGKYYEIYHNSRKVSDKTIEKRYMKYGKWRGLIFWLEMTRHWFSEKFPF